MAPRMHHLVRFFALVALAVSVTYMAQRSNARSDLTAEGLSQITAGTRTLLRSIGTSAGEDAEAVPPVVVTAYISKDVPRAYVPLRSRMLNILREMDAAGGPGLTVRIYEPEAFSEQAQEAVEKYGIIPRPLMSMEGGRVDTMPVFLGMAFTSGPREEVVPFFDRGLSVEYEIVRALEVVTQPKKKVVGIVRDDTKIMGDFDLQNRRQIPRWRVVDELEKQYEVRSLNPGAPIAPDVDLLFVPQVSSLSQESLDVIQAYLLAGRPTLLVADPLPFFNPKLAPSQPMIAPPQQGMMGGGQPTEQKGDYRGLLASIGVDWADDHIVFDLENPEQQLAEAPRSIVVLGERNGKDQFEGKDPVVDGLAQIIVLFGGDLRPLMGHSAQVDPILVTGGKGGWDRFPDFVDDSNFLFGLQFRGVPQVPTTKVEDEGRDDIAIGVRVSGGGSGGDTGGNRDINAIVLADLDMFADSFFQFHERGGDLDGDGLIDMRFDNVTFLLNVIDSLIGDDRFIDLRRRQPKFRRLSTVDEMTKKANEDRQEQLQAANDAADLKIKEAQTSLDEAVEAIRAEIDLDETTKKIMIRSAEAAENRRLQTQTEKIQREKAQDADRIKSEHARAVGEVRDRIRVAAILWPPVPAILFGMLVFLRKRRRESATIPESRKRPQS